MKNSNKGSSHDSFDPPNSFQSVDIAEITQRMAHQSVLSLILPQDPDVKIKCKPSPSILNCPYLDIVGNSLGGLISIKFLKG